MLQYFAEEKAAQRSCKRTGTKAGETIQLKPFTVDTKVYKKYMKRILESAYEKMWWHRKGAMYDIDENGIRVKGTTHKCPEAGTKLWVQHDGARPHTSKEAEKEWKALTTKYSKHELGALILEIFAQSAQSPDTNCLDKCEWPSSRPCTCHTSLSPPLPSVQASSTRWPPTSSTYARRCARAARRAPLARRQLAPGARAPPLTLALLLRPPD